MYFRFIVFISFLLLVSIPALADVNSPVIGGIRYGLNAGKTRIVLDLDNKTDFRVFALGDPWRVIVDLPRARWKIPQSAMASNALLKRYRSGSLDDGLTRIVFDLRRSAVISNAFLIPKSVTGKDRLVIDLEPASQNLFAAREKQVFGNANIRNKAPAASGLAVQPAALPVPARKPSARPESGLRKYTVVIDAGHGGEDPGAQAGGIQEKHITLAVARELRRQLEETGRYRVVMTRDKDVYMRLYQRVDLSREKKGDVFISIHADKIGRTGVRGASIYTLSKTASDTETARLAEGENNAGVVAGVDLSSESPDVAGILLDLAMREKVNESGLLARFLATSLRNENVRLLPNSHRAAGFAVLKAPDVPSVLIETGFLSNPEEAKLLSSSVFQSKIASAVVKGLDAYFRKIKSLQKL